MATAPKVASPTVALTGHEEAGSEGPGQDLGLEPHEFESAAREFIGERYWFTWKDEYRKISEVRILIKKVNRDDIRRIYQLAGTAEVIVKDGGIPVPKAFKLAVVMDQEGMVVDRPAVSALIKLRNLIDPRARSAQPVIASPEASPAPGQVSGCSPRTCSAPVVPQLEGPGQSVPPGWCPGQNRCPGL